MLCSSSICGGTEEYIIVYVLQPIHLQEHVSCNKLHALQQQHTAHNRRIYQHRSGAGEPGLWPVIAYTTGGVQVAVVAWSCSSRADSCTRHSSYSLLLAYGYLLMCLIVPLMMMAECAWTRCVPPAACCCCCACAMMPFLVDLALQPACSGPTETPCRTVGNALALLQTPVSTLPCTTPHAPYRPRPHPLPRDPHYAPAHRLKGHPSLPRNQHPSCRCCCCTVAPACALLGLSLLKSPLAYTVRYVAALITEADPGTQAAVRDSADSSKAVFCSGLDKACSVTLKTMNS